MLLNLLPHIAFKVNSIKLKKVGQLQKSTSVKHDGSNANSSSYRKKGIPKCLP